jgi:replicative DNA helicase
MSDLIETPTYALDLDEEVLAHICNPDSWVIINGEAITSSLIEDDFVISVFDWQQNHLRQHKQLATAATIEHEFDLELRPPETAIGDLLDRLRLRYMRNQGRQRLERIVKQQFDDPLVVPQMLLKEGRELSELLRKRGEIFGTGDIDRALRRYALKVEQGPGSSFGYDELDTYFYGMRGLSFWLGPRKGMKSWQMIKGTAANALAGRCVWLYSLELPAEETDMRLRHMLAGIPWWKYVHNRLNTEDLTILREVSEAIDASGIYKVVKPPRGHRSINEMVQTARDAGADDIFIDQLQYIEHSSGRSLGDLNDTGSYWGVCDEARDLSDSGPICIAHQFNRSIMGADEMPTVEQAKGSSAIEETATLVLGLWANKDMKRSGEFQIGTLVSRNAMDVGALWQAGVELTKGCDFTIKYRVEDEPDES